MIHIALVDDEVENRKQFLSYLHQYKKESGQQFRIFESLTAKSLSFLLPICLSMS